MSAGTEIERLLVRLVGDATSYQRMLKTSKSATKLAMTSIQRMGFQMEAVGRSITKVGRSMSAFGRSLALKVTAPIAIIGGLSVKAFSNFDNAMVQSTSIMGNLTDETKELMRVTATGLSIKVAQSPKELAESYFFLASAGKTAAQSMALLPQVAQFATAGAFDMALATDLLTDAQSALGLSSKNIVQDTKNMTRVADVLVKANTLANASVQQFATALTSKAGAALKVYNKDVEEGVAVLAAMADQGIKAELAGNALDRIIRLLSKAQLDNTKALKKYNVTLFDTTGTMRNMGDIVADLEVAFKDMSDIERAAALDAMGFEARVQGVILPLLGTSKAIKRYEAELRKAGGTTKEVAEKQMKSFANQMKLFRNHIMVTAIEIGETLAPMLTKLTRFLKRGLDMWKNLSPEVKRTAIMVALVAAAVGPLLIVFGGLVSLLGFVVTGFGVVIGVISPLLVGGGILAVLFLTLRHLNDELDVGGQLVRWFAGRWETLKEIIGPTINAIKNALSGGDVQLAFKIAWAQIHLSFIEGVAPLRKVWAAYIQFFTDTWTIAVSLFSNVWRETSLSIQALILKGMQLTGQLTQDEWAAAMAAIESDSRRGFKDIAAAQTEAILAAGLQAAKDKGGSTKLIASLKRQLAALRSTADNIVPKSDMPDFVPGLRDQVKGGIEEAIASVKPPPIVLTFIAGRSGTTLGSAEAERRMAEFQSAVKGGTGDSGRGSGPGASLNGMFGGPDPGLAGLSPDILDLMQHGFIDGGAPTAHADTNFGPQQTPEFLSRLDAIVENTLRMADAAENEAEKNDDTDLGFLDL